VRDQLVHVRRQAINLLRAQLRAEGVRVPTGAAETFVVRFERSAVSTAARAAMAPLLELLAAVAPLITQAEQWARSAARADAVTLRLMTALVWGPSSPSRIRPRLMTSVDSPRRGRSRPISGWCRAKTVRESGSGKGPSRKRARVGCACC
jgi:hypothetical protein